MREEIAKYVFFWFDGEQSAKAFLLFLLIFGFHSDSIPNPAAAAEAAAAGLWN